MIVEIYSLYLILNLLENVNSLMNPDHRYSLQL